MEITTSALQALKTTFSSIYREAYAGTAPWFSQVATEVTSSSSQNDYGWMAQLPRMREWLGERLVNNLLSQGYAIVNKTFELTIGVKREHIEDDNLGIYSPMMGEFGRQAAKHPDDLITTLMQAGHSTLCHDGQFFFDTDHPVNPKNASLGTQQNYWANGKALDATNYAAVRAAMMAFKGEDNRPLGVVPNLLIVPPALESAGKAVLEADFILATALATAPSTNVWKGSAKLLVVPELAGQDTTWYLADTSRMLKPFVFQRRRAPQFIARTRLDDEAVFTRNEFLYGVDSRDNAGYGLWFLAAKAVA